MRRAAFLDIETAGTDEHRDPILEIGIVLTDLDFRTRAQASWLIHPTMSVAETRDNAGVIVRRMHDENGLWEALRGDDVYRRDAADSVIARWLHDRNGSEHILIAGSGVGHFDRRFLKVQLPQVDRAFTYYPLDVGILRRACGFANRHDLVLEGTGGKTHRALEDAQFHLQEWLHYRAILGTAQVPAP